MHDAYAHWRENLERVARGLPVLDVNPNAPDCGRYKTRRHREGTWLPVAIYMKDGVLHAAVEKKVTTDAHEINEIWAYCAKTPVSEADYKAALTSGTFPDIPAPLPQRSNMPSDPVEALKVEIEDRIEQAEKWLRDHPEICSQTECDLARNMQAALADLGKKVENIRLEEKRPFLKQAAEVDVKYQSATSAAAVAVAPGGICARLKAAFGTFLRREEDRLKREAQERFERERKAAEDERRRIEAEQAKKFADDPIAALTEAPPELPLIPLGPEPVKVRAGGGIGPRAGLRDNWVGQINDYKACLAHYAEHADVRAAVEKLVKAQVKLLKETAAIPGVVVVNDRKVA